MWRSTSRVIWETLKTEVICSEFLFPCHNGQFHVNVNHGLFFEVFLAALKYFFLDVQNMLWAASSSGDMWRIVDGE